MICSGVSLSAALSRISYLCVPPNEMECGPYDLHCDEKAVVEQVAALRATAQQARAALDDFRCGRIEYADKRREALRALDAALEAT